MTGATAGAGAGIVLGSLQSIIGLQSVNKSVTRQIQAEGQNLAIDMRSINISREQLDRELGDILSENAMATAKNMATAKVLMSTSGTVGGTTSQVSKQAFMEQIKADADTINKARNQEMALLNQALSKRIAFRQQANALRSNIPSPMEGFLQTFTSAVQGAGQGMQVGSAFSSALPKGGIFPNGGTWAENNPFQSHTTPRYAW